MTPNDVTEHMRKVVPVDCVFLPICIVCVVSSDVTASVLFSFHHTPVHVLIVLCSSRYASGHVLFRDMRQGIVCTRALFLYPCLHMR